MLLRIRTRKIFSLKSSSFYFIFILIQKLKENELQNKEISNNKENNKEKNTEIILQNSKSNLSTLGLISILQSLIWKIKKSDFNYYKQNFFKIFSSKGILSNILSLANLNNKKSAILKEIDL